MRGAKKPYKFNEKQREYLEAKFNIGQGTGRKVKKKVLSTLDLQHPITYDQFNICTLVRDRKLTKLKVGMLQIICDALNLESPVPPIRRKASYLALLEEAVKKCSCNNC